jgi:cell division inhibitor SulA
MQNKALNNLIETTPQLWKGRRANHRQHTLSTGYDRLDARLPGGGWPVGSVSEVIAGRPGLGELSLLSPVLSHVGEAGQWLVLVDPPWLPYPPALEARGIHLDRLLVVRSGSEQESLWACEQALGSGRGGAVMAWPERIAFVRLRRLQLAAREQGKLAFLFRPERALEAPSPAALRLRLEPDGDRGTRVDLLKCRGSHPPPPVWIRFSDEPQAARRPRLGKSSTASGTRGGERLLHDSRVKPPSATGGSRETRLLLCESAPSDCRS